MVQKLATLVNIENLLRTEEDLQVQNNDGIIEIEFATPFCMKEIKIVDDIAYSYISSLYIGFNEDDIYALISTNDLRRTNGLSLSSMEKDTIEEIYNYLLNDVRSKKSDIPNGFEDKYSKLEMNEIINAFDLSDTMQLMGTHCDDYREYEEFYDKDGCYTYEELQRCKGLKMTDCNWDIYYLVSYYDWSHLTMKEQYKRLVERLGLTKENIEVNLENNKGNVGIHGYTNRCMNALAEIIAKRTEEDGYKYA